MIPKLQEQFDIYLETKHAPSDYPPTYITTNGIMLSEVKETLAQFESQCCNEGLQQIVEKQDF